MRHRRIGAACALTAAGLVAVSGLGSPAQAAFPGLNGKIGCEGVRSPDTSLTGAQRTEVFTVNPDGTGETVLTDNAIRDGDPGFSPDGSMIAFESFRDGFSEAYKMASDGSGATRLTFSGNNEDRSASWSPDGTKIAFHSTRDALPVDAPPLSSRFEVYVMDADGSNQVRLTNNFAQDTFPAWSPDGSRLAFLSTRDSDIEIYTMNPDGTDPQRLTSTAGEDAHPSWSPDGTQIAFHSRRDSTTEAAALEIYRMNADGSNQTRVTTDPGVGFKYFPVWSPDGTRIAFNANLDASDPGNTDVYHVDAADGSDPVRVTTAPGFDGRCDWATIPRQAVAPPPPAPPPVPVPVPTTYPLPTVGSPLTAKLSLARATINRRDRMLDVLAPITSRASGRVNVELHAAGRRFRFTAAVNSADGRIRFRQRIPAAQARMGTGILTIRYRGDADTRPQTVRLRAAAQKAVLRLSRPTLDAAGRLRAAGTISARARGVVRVQLEYVADGQTRTHQFNVRIRNGRWSLNEVLSPTIRNEIARRSATVHSYTLFTGYLPARMRGEMRSFQVLGDR